MTNLRTQKRRTVQSRTRQEQGFSIGALYNFARAGEIIAPWWSRTRDKQLVEFLLSSDAGQGAFWMIGAKLVNVPYRVEARDRAVKAHVKLADQYQAILENMIQFGQGWSDFWNRFLYDLWSTDNGGFGEVIGLRGNPSGPIKGPPVGLAHLDSLRCTRTSDPEWPVRFQATDGKEYRFHHTRVIYTSQESSARSEMNGVGHCWLSRCLNNAQRLVDKDVYFQEALGSRPKREILLTKGIDPDDFILAMRNADEGMDNQNLRRYSKTVVTGDRDRTDIGIDRVPLSYIPEGFDESEVTRIGMAFIALAGGFPLRWVWPASVTGATKADALFSHIAGVGGGAQWHLNKMRDLLSYSDKATAISGALPQKFLPKELRLVFDFQDDEQDRQQAEIRKSRADVWKIDLETGATDIRTVREQMLAAGDLTQAQFDRMELEAGRLPNGDDVLSMYDSNDPIIQDMLDLGVDEPLLIDANDPIEMLVAIVPAALAVQARMVQAAGRTERDKARRAMAALGKLKGIYEQLASESIEEEIAVEQAASSETTEAEATPPGEGENTEGEEVKIEVDETAKIETKSTTVIERILGRISKSDAIDLVVDELITLDPAESECKKHIDNCLYEIERHQTHVKGFDFGARVGQRIRGSLFRGAGGKFANEAELSQVKNEILRRLIERLRAKRTGGTGGKKTGAAKKKPKGGGGGGKKKPSAEELARKKREAEKAERSKVLAAVADSFETDAADLESLAGFIDGAELDSSTAQRLARDGLIRFDADGRVFATAEGKSFIRAANKGETRQATEALSKGVERARKTQQRVDDKREQANRTRLRADELDEKAAKLTEEADKFLAGADGIEPGPAADRLRERAKKKQEQAAKATQDAIERREEADDLDAVADKLNATIGGGALSTVDRDLLIEIDRQDMGSNYDIPDLDRLVAAGLVERDLNTGMPRLLDAGREALKTKATDEPPRGDFEQEIVRQLKPIFRRARRYTLDALERGVQPDDEELRKELIALFVPILTDAALFKVNLLEDQFTTAFDAAEEQAEAERWARVHAATMVAGLIVTTQLVISGIAPDATQSEMKATVDRAFNEDRRERIGITETTVALMWGALFYQRLMARRGVEIELIWYTQEDERVCPICGALQGARQEDWSQQFPKGPPAHVRCRCDVIARRKR